MQLVPKHSIEELLIDFCELEGDHSGANLADALWKSLTFYGIEKQVNMTPIVKIVHAQTVKHRSWH
jgi:hypothetical protein